MPRYFFHIHNGLGFLADHEGLLCGDIEEARAQAALSIRSILADELKTIGVVDLRGRIDIVDDEGRVTSVPFASVIEIRTED